MTIYPRTRLGNQQQSTTRRRNGLWLHWLTVSLFSLLLGGTLLLFAPATAFAHAEYVSSDPAINAMLTKVPTTVTIHFSENVDPSGSDVLIYDVNGKQVSTDAAQVDRADLKTMHVNLSGDSSEIYVVYWHTVSAVEGHHDAGSFRFFVNISPMLKGMVSGKMSMPGSSSSMSSGSTVGSSQTATSTTPGTSLWMTVVIGVIGLVVGGAAVFVATRRRIAGSASVKEK
jgi:methionine-rich copper-binding protein CopC